MTFKEYIEELYRLNIRAGKRERVMRKKFPGI
jgi:hypothetical protein